MWQRENGVYGALTRSKFCVTPDFFSVRLHLNPKKTFGIKNEKNTLRTPKTLKTENLNTFSENFSRWHLQVAMIIRLPL